MGRTGNALIPGQMTVESNTSEPQREQALLSWIQQFAPYGIITLDQAFRIQTWNAWMEVHSSKRFSDVVGKSLFEVFPEIQHRRLAAQFERALQGQSSVLSTSLHQYLLPLPSPYRETGQALMLQTARIAPLYSEGAVCGIVVVIEDVTQRETQAEALSRQHRRDELLSWALAELLKTEQPQKAVRHLFFKIAEQLDFDTFLIYLRDIESTELTLTAQGGIPVEHQPNFAACPFLPIMGTDMKEMLVLNGVQKLEQPQYEVLRKAGVSAAVAIPLSVKDRNLGLLCFASASRDRIATVESDLLGTLAQYLATAIDRENTSFQLRKAKEQLSNDAQFLEKSVQERTARLQETISELETFSYTIAHDLRAPVRTMSGYCAILFEDFPNGLPPAAKLILQKIARASGQMEALTRDLLEFSRISRQEFTFTTVEIEPIIEELGAMRLPEVRQAITVRSPLHVVRGHKSLLQQVFSNLVDNAIKFSKPGTPPKITIYSEPVHHISPNTRSRPLMFSSTETIGPEPTQPASTETLPHFVRIWVCDEGIGIPPAAHEKIFGIFERGSASKAFEGTGIGLAIVLRAMQRMGGTCGVESELEKGSRFWLELPSASAAQDAGTVAAEVAGQSPR